MLPGFLMWTSYISDQIIEQYSNIDWIKTLLLNSLHELRNNVNQNRILDPEVKKD